MSQSDMELRTVLAPVLVDFSKIEQELPNLDKRVRAIIQRFRLALDPGAANANKTLPRLLTPDQQAEFLAVLERRLSQTEGLHYKRPEGIVFEEVKKALEANPEAVWSLYHREVSDKAPDVVASGASEFVFADCQKESPSGHGCVDYDDAVNQAQGSGGSMCSEAVWRAMQENGNFDCQTSTWLLTDPAIREEGYALCGYRWSGGPDVYRRTARRGNRHKVGWRWMLRVPRVP